MNLRFTTLWYHHMTSRIFIGKKKTICMGENVNLDKLCFRQVKVYQTGWIYINKRLKRKHDIKRKQFLEGNTEEFSSKFKFSSDVGLLDLRSRESTIELIQNYELSKCVWNSSEMEDRGRKQEVCWAHHHFPAIAGFFFFFSWLSILLTTMLDFMLWLPIAFRWFFPFPLFVILR